MEIHYEVHYRSSSGNHAFAHDIHAGSLSISNGRFPALKREEFRKHCWGHCERYRTWFALWENHFCFFAPSLNSRAAVCRSVVGRGRHGQKGYGTVVAATSSNEGKMMVVEFWVGLELGIDTRKRHNVSFFFFLVCFIQLNLYEFFLIL